MNTFRWEESERKQAFVQPRGLLAQICSFPKERKMIPVCQINCLQGRAFIQYSILESSAFHFSQLVVLSGPIDDKVFDSSRQLICVDIVKKSLDV